MIGDRATDVEAGIRAGCQAYLFDCGNLDCLAAEIERLHFSK
jgi:histidinol phosphatase-like enzyme